MWRQTLRFVKGNRRGSIATLTGTTIAPVEAPLSNALAEHSVIRNFSRRPRGILNDPEEELLERKDVEEQLGRSKTPSATEMEFFSLLGNNDEDDFTDAYGDEDEDETRRADAEYKRKQEEIRLELDSRTGREWTDPWQISEEQWMSLQTADDLPDWSPDYVSRISQERLNIHEDGVLSLEALASLSLPPETCPHPGLGQTKEYAAYRKKFHYEHVAKIATDMARPRVEQILKLKTWQEKQNAVDELFETIEDRLRNQEEILGLHPLFGSWVSTALEDYLTKVQEGTLNEFTKKTDSLSKDAESEPVFMDCYDPNEPDKMVPSIFSPLQPHARDGPGRMVEEWELAANKKTKRIMVRPCTRTIAQTLENNESCRIFVHGRKGVGKTAVLASVVASARKSGHLVMYLPDGDRLRKNGFFVTPSSVRDGMYDLQDLSQEACQSFLESHEKDLNGIFAEKIVMEKFFKESQIAKIDAFSDEKIELVDLLKHAAEKKSNAPMCFSVVVETLMNQAEKPFYMVLDEFNCYFDRGHYFHMSYDENVREAIPYDRINLFEHALGAMGLSANIDDEVVNKGKVMQKGGIIVGITESRAVPRKVSDGLTNFAKSQAESDGSLTVIEVPHFSSLEVDHVLANFESIGLGNLRLDRGDTLMDSQEVAYLKMVSGSIGQKLLDASIL